MTPIRSARRNLVFLVLAVLLGAASASALLLAPSPAIPSAGASASRVRDFQMDIVPADVPMGEKTWHAWTFNGTVPGPTLRAQVGDVIRVTVHNQHTMIHSFHTHLSPYSLENDGSQLNTITGIGGMAMIAPGKSYTYEFVAVVPGLFYYHCHSADGGKPISQHIAQGLYGAILVSPPEEAPAPEEFIFMAERGFDAPGGTPYFLMNGKGFPGGEHGLMELFHEKGLDGVKDQLGVTIPVISGKAGQPMRISVVNIGDAIHSFHLHGMTAYSLEMYPGRPVPAQVAQLAPGAVERMVVTPTQPGVWLFHCHVVSHADAGMIGVFVVEPAEGQA